MIYMRAAKGKGKKFKVLLRRRKVEKNSSKSKSLQKKSIMNKSKYNRERDKTKLSKRKSPRGEEYKTPNWEKDMESSEINVRLSSSYIVLCLLINLLSSLNSILSQFNQKKLLSKWNFKPSALFLTLKTCAFYFLIILTIILFCVYYSVKN